MDQTYSGSESFKNKLADQLIGKGAIKSKEIEEAFRKVPRELFVHGLDIEEIYSDSSIITKTAGVPVTSSTQPSLMAVMLEMLELKEGLKVLEIGTGTGYNAAIISEIVKNPEKVFTVDIDPDNIEDAHSNLVSAGYAKVTAECQDGSKGLSAHSPYDRILATCSVKEIPESWTDQLNEKGLIVAPVWINGIQITPSLVKEEGFLIGKNTILGGFMEMRSKAYQEMKPDSLASEDELLICSERQELFERDKLFNLLRGKHREEAFPIAQSERYDFFAFISLHEKKSVELFLNSDNNEFGFGDNTFGIIDCDNGSACLITRDCKLLNYGNPSSRERIFFLLREWEHLGKPKISQLRVSIYPKEENAGIKNKDIVIEKEFSKLVISIAG